MYDVIVIGAGHAGCEAALASARLGCRTLLLTMALDNIALMPCNPSIGGPAKGHVVREIDALGGEMARNIDKTFIQIRMLNTGKGPAVQALRAQADKKLYGLQMKYILERQPDLDLKQALVEEFIEGKELTVGILENGKTTILPILEIDFSTCKDSGEYFYSWRMKEYQGNRELGLVPTFYCPGRLDKHTEAKVKEIALKTHHAVGCFDISRTDIRLSQDGIPYVLEINPLPGLDPRESNFPIMAYAAGMKYEDLIEAILMSAYKRREGLN